MYANAITTLKPCRIRAFIFGPWLPDIYAAFMYPIAPKPLPPYKCPMRRASYIYSSVSKIVIKSAVDSIDLCQWIDVHSILLDCILEALMICLAIHPPTQQHTNPVAITAIV